MGNGVDGTQTKPRTLDSRSRLYTAYLRNHRDGLARNKHDVRGRLGRDVPVSACVERCY